MNKKEAIEVVKNHLPHSSFKVLREALETLIPELAESEDELMRKEAISIIKQYNIICEREGDKCYTADRVITWLENQDRQMTAKGERKNIALSLINYLDNNRVECCMDLSSMECEDIEDACINSKWAKLYNYMKKKLEKQDTPKDYNSIDPHFGKPIEMEPKFKVGDWIFSPAWGTAHIIGTGVIGVNDSDFLLEYTDGKKEYVPSEYVNSAFDKWNIEDAKDGDVLATKQFILIFRPNKYKYPIDDPRFYCRYDIESGSFKKIDEFATLAIGTKYVPATNEQRDLLFKKMKESGYEWDADKKELKKIEQKPLEW